MINWRKIRTTTKSGERASAVKPHITISFVKRIRCIHTHMEIVRNLDISISKQHASDDALTTARKYVLCEMCAFRSNSKQRSMVRKMYRCVCVCHTSATRVYRKLRRTTALQNWHHRVSWACLPITACIHSTVLFEAISFDWLSASSRCGSD